MKRRSILIVVGVLMHTCLYSQTALHMINKTEADLYWETKPIYKVNYTKLPDTVKARSYYELNIGPTKMNRLPDSCTQEELNEYTRKKIYDEIYKRLFIEWGMEFWKRYPDDVRRFDWFLEANSYAGWPGFFLNIRSGVIAQIKNQKIIPLDTIARNEWNLAYKKYLKEFLASKEVDEDRKKGLLSIKLTDDLFKFWRNSKADKFDVDGYFNYAMAYAKLSDPKLVSRYLRIIQRDKIDLGLDDADVSRYIGLLKNSGITEYQLVGSQMESLRKLKEQPVQLNAKSISGAQISLEQYRGKLVLLDFWSLGCSICIEKMPEFKTAYEKYKNRGFEVVSACFYSEKERESILAIHKKINASWPLILLDRAPGKSGGKIKETYGFQSVPQLLLLDEEGKLLHYMGELMNTGGLERLIKQHLENKQIKTGK